MSLSELRSTWLVSSEGRSKGMPVMPGMLGISVAFTAHAHDINTSPRMLDLQCREPIVPQLQKR